MRAAILIVLLAATTLATAQTTQTTAPDGKIHTLIEGIDIPSVPNAPFTAKIVVTWDEPLADGGTVSRKYYTQVARDGQGRVRRETRDLISASSSAEPRLRSFFINDPTSAMRITCTVAALKCNVTDFHPRVALAETAIGLLPEGTSTLSRESLGEQTADSLPVVGTRETVTSAAGTHGSDRVLISSKDLWYSPDLQMYLSVVRTDPQFGRQTLTVTDLVRGEPDTMWFSVPSGYEIIDARSKSGIQVSQTIR